MKALWKGNISFALVNIPVKLYGASHKRDINFHLLHKKCSTPLTYERYCPTCKVDVAWEDTIHGYEYEKGKFVVIADEEIERIPSRTSKSIDILRFIDAKEIEPIYYDKAYYLEPVEGGERAYALLRETMKDSEKVALAKITFKDKEHVAIIRVFRDTRTLHTLFYADEIMKPETLNIPKRIALDDKELNLATELVRHFLGRFNIDSYHDEFRDSVMELIKAKIAGREIKVAPKKEVEKVVSLMDALKRSLEKKKKAV
ncbi:MAG: Ku protein [Thermodesulfovibrionales bacterium]